MKFLITIIIILFSSVLHAGNTTITWTLPTTTEECANGSGTPTIESTEVWQLVGSEAADSTEMLLTGLMPGDYTYVASVTDDNGEVSRITTPPVTKTVFSIQATDDKAYTVVQSGGSFVAFIIGTVPVGTVCNPDNMVKGKFDFQPFTGYGVPVSMVTITGNTEPVLVVATCQ
jgi:hypothetical protein